MTQNKNKKGIAKKALSISLVAAMLATSNVPVWASGFEAVDPTAEGFAVESAAPETEAVDAAENVAALSDTVTVTEGNLTLDLKVDNTSTLWNSDNVADVEVSGTIKRTDTGADLGSWKYAWKEGDTSYQDSGDGTVTAVSQMSLIATDKMAGKTLELYVYRDDADAKFNIPTGLVVTVKKRQLDKITCNESTSFAYTGFERSYDGAVTVEGISNGEVISSDYYTVDSTTGTNAGDKITVRATAKPDAPYEGSVETTFAIAKRNLDATTITNLIAATVTGDLSYEWVGSSFDIDKNNVNVTETVSSNKGVDNKLAGNDLNAAVKRVFVDNTSGLGNERIGIVLDTSKLPNFNSLVGDEAVFYVEDAVEITARDLSTCDVYMKYGAVGTGTTLDQLGSTPDMIISDGTHNINLDYKKDFTLSAKKDGVNVTVFDTAGTYELTLTAVAGGKAINSKTISLLVQDNVATTASSAKFGVDGSNYGAEYNGKAYEPTKDDLGTIVVNGTTGESTLDTSSYQISGYSNNTDASVSGVFTAHVYIVPSTGAYEGQTVDIPFTIDPRTVKPADITVPETITYNEEYVKAEEYNVPITVVANDKNGKNPITLSSSDYTVSYAYVDGNDTGSTASNALGDKIQATIQILNTNFIGAPSVKAAKTTEITNPALSENAIKINPSSYTYTGGVITPEFVVMDGLFILEEGEEYEVVGVTDATNVGTGKITVKGIGNYSGTASATFEITPADTSDVKVSIEKEQYKGSQIRPRKFTATLNGNDVTNQFEIVGYGENIKAGTGTVILAPKAGNENFTGGNITAEFTIYAEEIDGVVKVYDQYGIDITNKYEAEDQTAGETFTFDGTAKTFSKETFEITTADTKATVDDFEIKYVDNVSGKTVNGKSYNLAYVYVVAKDGSGYTGDEEIITADGTVIKDVVAKFAFGINSVKFVKENVTVSNGVYAGGLPVKPEVLVQIGGNTLVEGQDYELVFSDADKFRTEVTNAKLYSVTVKGINGYAGSNAVMTNSWGIDKKDLADCDVTLTDGVLTVMNGAVPVPTTEYTTTTNDNGSITVTAATNSKNYTGSVTVFDSVPEVPDAPDSTVLSVTDRTTSTVSLSWDKVEGAEGYTIWFRSEYDTEMSRKIIFDGDQTTWTQTGLQPGTKYFYAMRAWVKDAEGNYIFSDVSPTQRGTTKPIAARIASVSVSNGKIKVNLAGAAAGAEMYSMCYGDSRTCFAANDFKVGIRTQYTTRTLTPTFEPGTYYVCVKSYRDLGNGKRVYGAWSNTFRAVVK